MASAQPHDIVCNEFHVPDIARNVTKWREVAPYLGLSLPTVEAVERDGIDEEDKRKRMLYAWINAEGSNATFDKLVKAFEDCGNKNVAESVTGTI